MKRTGFSGFLLSCIALAGVPICSSEKWAWPSDSRSAEPQQRESASLRENLRHGPESPIGKYSVDSHYHTTRPTADRAPYVINRDAIFPVLSYEKSQRPLLVPNVDPGRRVVVFDQTISPWSNPNKPRERYDQCKCVSPYNCVAPGVLLSSCSVGKSYCCFGFAKMVTRRPESGTLSGPGGSVGISISNPQFHPNGNYVPNIVNIPLFQGPEKGVLIGPGGPTGLIGPIPYRHPNNQYDERFDRPKVSQNLISNVANGILVGPGGPTGIIGPPPVARHENYPKQNKVPNDVLVGPGGPTGQIGPRVNNRSHRNQDDGNKNDYNAEDEEDHEGLLRSFYATTSEKVKPKNDCSRRKCDGSSFKSRKKRPFRGRKLGPYHIEPERRNQ